MKKGKLFAVSDLHVAYKENRDLLEAMRPESENDWLLIAGDVAELAADIEWALQRLRDRFSVVVWTPGNHELWTHPSDPVQLRGEQRYQHLVAICRRLGVVTPEDPYLIWEGTGGPIAIAPVFVLYDYSFRQPTAASKTTALEQAYQAGVVCTDEFFLHTDPYPSREAWCHQRLAVTERRLSAIDPGLRTILINHYPLIREPTQVLWHPEFALWCGTERTSDWHLRFRAATVIYGHLHISRTTWRDGVPFEEVSLGYPREWQRRTPRPAPLRQIMPELYSYRHQTPR